jgi:predicted enzyme related to lactoylglutathione lyase
MATRKTRRSPAARKKAAKPRAARPRAKKAARRPAARAARSASAPRRKKRRDPETLRLRSFVPSFTVNDLQRSVAFYSDVLGFFVSQRWSSDSGVLQGVMLKAGTCEMGLMQDDWAKGRDRKKGEGVRLTCETVQAIDALAARIKAAGGRLTQEPRDEMGSRSLWVDDPDGYHLSLSRKL